MTLFVGEVRHRSSRAESGASHQNTQNATGMQVTSAVLAAMVWAAENTHAGFVEADEMDHARCLEVQRPYLGRIETHYTDWTPIQHRINSFADLDGIEFLARIDVEKDSKGEDRNVIKLAVEQLAGRWGRFRSFSP
mgnify:CR=1 FL=1